MPARCVRAAIAVLGVAPPLFADDFVPPTLELDDAPDTLVAADVDGDGFDDLVVITDAGAPRVVFSLAGGGLGADTPADLPAFTNTSWVFGDVDGDGRTDAVAFTPLFATLPVYLGNGDASFTQVASVVLPSFGTEAILGDVDGDGLDDLVAELGSGDALRVSFGDATTPFATFVDVPTPGASRPLVVGDVDGDGHGDIVTRRTVAFSDASVEILLGLGDGTFALLPVSVLDDFRDVSVGDHDGDGDDELALLDSAVLEIVDVASDRSLDVLATFDVFDDTIARALWSDVDADGDDDVLLALGSPEFRLILSTPGEAEPFGAPHDTAAPGAPSVALLDVNRDGAIDVVFGIDIFVSPPALYVVDGRGDGTFDDHVPGSVLFDVGEVDGDGRLDIVTVERGFAESAFDRIVLLRGAFGTAFERADPILTTNAEVIAVALGDADADGHLDLWYIDEAFGGTPTPRLTVRRGDGAGGFSDYARLLFDPFDDIRTLDVLDMTGDGRADAVLGGDRVSVIASTAGGDLAELWSFESPWLLDVEVAEIDGVAPPDLVATASSTASTDVFLGAGDGTWGPPVTSPLDWVLAVADVNDDGRADLLAGTQGSNDPDIYAGLGDGTFAFLTDVDVPVPFGSTVDPVFGDVDGDGIADLVVAEFFGRLSIARGLGGGAFAPGSTPISLGEGPRVIALADVYGDGLPALLSSPTAGVTVVPNAARAWRDLGWSTGGAAGFARLEGEGSLVGGTPIGLRATGATPTAPATLVIGFSELVAPFAGGVLVPSPDVVISGLATDASGAFDVASTWPAGVPSGTELVLQLWCVDAGSPTGFSSTVGLGATTP